MVSLSAISASGLDGPERKAAIIRAGNDEIVGRITQIRTLTALAEKTVGGD